MILLLSPFGWESLLKCDQWGNITPATYKLIDTIALSECYLINFSLVSMCMFFYCTHIAKFSLGVFTYEIVVWNSAARKVNKSNCCFSDYPLLRWRADAVEKDHLLCFLLSYEWIVLENEVWIMYHAFFLASESFWLSRNGPVPE